MRKILTLTALCAICFSTCIYGMKISPEQTDETNEQSNAAQEMQIIPDQIDLADDMLTDLIDLADAMLTDAQYIYTGLKPFFLKSDPLLRQAKGIVIDLQNLKQQILDLDTSIQESALNTVTQEEIDEKAGKLLMIMGQKRDQLYLIKAKKEASIEEKIFNGRAYI